MERCCEDERWVAVQGYEGRYEVSSCGRIFSVLTKKLLKQSLAGSGRSMYPAVRLSNGQQTKTFRVHKLVALHYLEGTGIVRHKDNNKANAHENNLMWGTHQDNSMDTQVALGQPHWVNLRAEAKANPGSAVYCGEMSQSVASTITKAKKAGFTSGHYVAYTENNRRVNKTLRADVFLIYVGE